MKYPADMDKAMIPICDALNSLDEKRLQTVFSCEGHGKEMFYVCLFIFDPHLIKPLYDIFSTRWCEYTMYIKHWYDERDKNLIVYIHSWALGVQQSEEIRKAEYENITNRIKQAWKELKA